MQIDKQTLPLLALLRLGGLNRYLRGWNRVFTLLFPQVKQQDRHLYVEHFGVTYLANPRNYIDWNVLCYGDYENHDLSVFKELLGGGDRVCLDIGSNVGHHSLFFASLGWTVHAFEPNPVIWPEFEAKVRVSGLQSIILHRIGLSDTDSVLEFELENVTNSGTGRFIVAGASPIETNVSLGFLPLKNGDQYLLEHRVNRVDVLKVDIQGFEPEALKGLKETIARDRPIACIEISPDNRWKFGSLEDVARCFPTGYVFVFSILKTFGLFRHPELKRCSEYDFQRLNGNLFCIPSEASGLPNLAVTGESGSRPVLAKQSPLK